MCRLYAFRSTEETKVECTLVHAQNALMAQSRRDLAGYSHAHGWGLVAYVGDEPRRERQAWAAYHGEHFPRAVARIYARSVLAHVRRATVGVARLENTHPFVDGRWSFAHNGTVPRFAELRGRLLAATAPRHRAAIEGETDSEHLFRHLLTLLEGSPAPSPLEALRTLTANIDRWVAETGGEARVGLNLMLTNGREFFGTRYGRTLHFVERRGVYDCEICGFPHIHHAPDREHRAIVVASEPITTESWREIPERSLWRVDANAAIAVEPL